MVLKQEFMEGVMGSVEPAFKVRELEFIEGVMGSVEPAFKVREPVSMEKY